ncbi:MANSC domain-containing protein 4-like isoform X2 [Poeciliopsis prolifica]|uniref:MANSC domain-containing protein 4-like isoform X2 n=1 Tax=Poeciliopsis prolifica TaxID=188132 RepID=UPI00241357B7|nr:MANSC domain-containing protein 4-like isoform X2 [Poeciliopsis prolifica]
MRGLLTVLGLVCHTESMCSPTSYYKNCWIRRFPGISIDVEASQRRGAQLLRSYPEDTALECSRRCCLARNLSCNLAVFHFDAANCVHLHCPSLESCIVSHRENVVLYNITKGVDPDLLVFGKHFTSNIHVLPHHYSRVNASDPLPSDKRNFIHPPPHPVRPPTAAPSVEPFVPPTPADATTAQQRTTDPTTKSAFTEQTSPSSDSHVHTAILTTAARSAESSIATSNSVTSPTSVDLETPPGFSTTTAKPFTSIPATTVHKVTSSASATTTLTGETEHGSADVTAGGNYAAGGDEGQEVGEDDTVEELGSGWHVAAHTLLVAVAICVTLLLSCCCSVLLVVSWRGQRKRMDRYRTSWRGKRASMRLIKYVLVKENS